MTASNEPTDSALQRSVNPAGGDYAKGSIDRHQGTLIEGDQFNLSGDFRQATLYIKSNIYQWVRERPADPETIARAQALLAEMPVHLVVHPHTAPLAEVSRMTFSRNPLFVGREVDLLTLAHALKGQQITSIGQAAVTTGLGGIGKTNLATEFVHRYGPFFAGGVFWINFGDPSGIESEVAVCGGAGGLNLRPEFATIPLSEQVEAVKRAWSSPIPRLLVFDNCDSDDTEALIDHWRPKTGGCRVLITSRRGAWDATLGIVALPLGVLARSESIMLLRSFRRAITESDADAVAAELGDLPLALHLAGSFLVAFDDLSIAEYLDELRSEAILRHASMQGVDLHWSVTNHDLHVARTFAISLNRLRADDELDTLARALLVRAAWCAPGVAIPRELLFKTIERPDKAAERQAQRALSRLGALGLITADEDGLVLHGLLARFVLSSVGDAAAQGAVEGAIHEALPNEIIDRGNTPSLMALLPHLRHLTERAMVREDSQAVSLMIKLDYILSAQGDYVGARPFAERALAATERLQGALHPATAITHNNLAELLRTQGDYAGARSHYEQALAIWEQSLGPNHTNTAAGLDNLAELLRTQGDYARARPLYEQALAIWEQSFGPSHLSIAICLNNLALLLDDIGDYATARPLHERALAIREQVLDSNHPDMATSLDNLAVCLEEGFSEYENSRKLKERALTIREQALGPNHPDTATSLNNLAKLLCDLEDYPAAYPLYERALRIREQVFGPNHPSTATSLNNLAELLRIQGDYTAARPRYERALAIDEAVYGLHHPRVGTDLNNLALLCRDEGQMTEASILMRRALVILKSTLGQDHPNTQSSQESLVDIETLLVERP